MDILKFNLNENGNKVKILNATNGGPWHKRHAADQFRSNFIDYKAARIPYSHDITRIFPDFNADENNHDSYAFSCIV